MPGEPIDNRTLLRKTLVTVGAMVGGSALLVGILTLILSSIVGRAVGTEESPSASTTPAAHGVPPSAKNAPGGATKSK